MMKAARESLCCQAAMRIKTPGVPEGPGEALAPRWAHGSIHRADVAGYRARWTVTAREAATAHPQRSLP